MGFDAVSYGKAQEALNRKIGISDLNVTNIGSNGQVLSKDTSGNLTFINNGSGTDTKDLKVSSTDTTSDFLENKIVGTTNKINVAKLNTGADEQLQISLDNSYDTNISNLQNNEGKIKLNDSDTLDYFSNKIDNSTIQIVDNKLVATTLSGLTVTLTELNYLLGVTSNVQSQINNLSSAFHLEGQKNTKAELDAITGMTVGQAYIVVSDESNGNVRDWYVYSSAGWVNMGVTNATERDFSTNPLNLLTETTGTLPQSKVDLSGIAKSTDLTNYLAKSTYDSDNNGKVDDSDKLGGQLPSYYAKSTDLDNKVDKITGKGLSTNDYSNSDKTKVDLISTSGNGSKVLCDNGLYKTISEATGSGASIDDATISDTTTYSSNKITSITGDINDSGLDTSLKGKSLVGMVESLFGNAIAIKQLMVNAIADSDLTINNTNAEISNKILSDKQLIVNALATKGVTVAQSDSLSSYATKINGIVQNSTLSNTKLNQSASSTYQITLTNSTTIDQICTSILEYVAGTQGVVQYDCSFNNSDSSSFETVPHILFDGDMYEDVNTIDTQMIQTIDNTNLATGEYEVEVDKTQFRNYSIDISVEHDDTSGNPFIKLVGTYDPVLVQANSDINLNNVDTIASIVWTTTVSSTNDKLLLLYSINSGVTWHGYNKFTSTITDVDINSNSNIEGKGISVSDINSLSATDLANIRNNSSKIRFAYYFDMNNANDTVKNSELKLTVNMKGTNQPASTTHASWSFDGDKTITYSFPTAGTYTINYIDNN